MIHQYKTNICSRPVPAVEFDNFLKARYEKQSIIQSQSQPIQSKVQSFYELLKLTKSGSTFTKQSMRKPQQSTIVRNHTQSAKTIQTLSQNNNNQYEFNNRFEDIESEQAQFKKLNRMVYGLQEWEEDKARVSMYVERKEREGKGNGVESKKRVEGNEVGGGRGKQRAGEKVIKQRKQQAYSSCDGKRFRGFYSPLRKHQANSQLSKISSHFTKTTAKLNYPPSLLNCNFLTPNPNHFKQLKTKIKLLQDRARNQYGLDFDNTNKHSSMNIKQSQPSKNSFFCDGDDEPFEQKSNRRQLAFSDLQLGPMLAKQQSPQRKFMFKQLKYGHKQNDIEEDDSIPKGLIEGVIKNKTDSLYRIVTNKSRRGLGSAVVENSRDNKLKKGYLSRPKTFKPSYMYVQI